MLCVDNEQADGRMTLDLDSKHGQETTAKGHFQFVSEFGRPPHGVKPRQSCFNLINTEYIGRHHISYV
jgi:hypothetical protein